MFIFIFSLVFCNQQLTIEHLSKSQLLLNFTFEIKPLYSPFMNNFKKNQFYISMTMYPPYIDFLPPQGVMILFRIQGSTIQFLHYLEYTFGISKEQALKHNFIKIQDYYLFNDPSDYVCYQCLSKVLKLIKCKNGIVSLISQNILKAKYYSITINKTLQTMYISIYIITKYSKLYNVLLNNYINKCTNMRQQILYGQAVYKVPINGLILKDLIKSKGNHIRRIKIQSERYLLGQYYNWTSNLVHKIANPFEQQKTVTIYQIIPFFYKPFLPELKVLMNQTQIQPKFYVQKHQQLILLKFKYVIPANSILRIDIKLNRKLQNFQFYQPVGIGGQDIPMSILFIGDKLIDLRTQLILNSALTTLLPEPDFSMPFKVITFSMSCLGYMWVNMWRTIKDSQLR